MEEILGAKDPTHYRNKSQYPVGADGAIGFYRARSHQVVPVERCLIQSGRSAMTPAAAAVGRVDAALPGSRLRRDQRAGAWCATCTSG